jgi:hypothetical protein
LTATALPGCCAARQIARASARVVLVSDVERFDEPGRHQSDLVSQPLKLPRPVLRPAARFHPDPHGARLTKYSRNRAQRIGLLTISPVSSST